MRDKSVLLKENPYAALCAAFQVIKRNMLHMRNLFLALLHKWAGNSLKEVVVIFIGRKYFSKMLFP